MTKASRWAWVISLVVATGAALVLSFLLAMATNNRSFYEQHYPWLFWLNLTVAALLMLVIAKVLSVPKVTAPVTVLIDQSALRISVAPMATRTVPATGL